MTHSQEKPTAFIGVYDADSTLLGEVSYWIGARLGKRHCSLCDITHGLFTMKSEWKSCSQSLDIPFETFHRNDAPLEVLESAAGEFPIVLARYDSGLKVVFNGKDLDSFTGDTQRFIEALSTLV